MEREIFPYRNIKDTKKELTYTTLLIKNVLAEILDHDRE